MKMDPIFNHYSKPQTGGSIISTITKTKDSEVGSDAESMEFEDSDFDTDSVELEDDDKDVFQFLVKKSIQKYRNQNEEEEEAEEENMQVGEVANTNNESKKEMLRKIRNYLVNEYTHYKIVGDNWNNDDTIRKYDRQIEKFETDNDPRKVTTSKSVEHVIRKNKTIVNKIIEDLMMSDDDDDEETEDENTAEDTDTGTEDEEIMEGEDSETESECIPDFGEVRIR